MRLLTCFVGFAVSLAGQTLKMPEPNYCVTLLNAHPDRVTLPKEEAERIQRDHIAHLTALGEKGWAVAAGPMEQAKELRGIVISKCASLEEADRNTTADPAVVNKRLTVKTYRWAGPEGIGDAYREHRKANPEARDKMVKLGWAFLRETPKFRTGMPLDVIIKEHIASVQKGYQEGVILAAGPLTNPDERFGLFIVRAESVDEVLRIVSQDPFVKHGYATIEAHMWWVADRVMPIPPQVR